MSNMINIREFVDSQINNFINEEQVFNFDSKKNEIIKFIDKIKRGEKISEFDSPFYKIIAGDPKVGSANKIGFDDSIKNQWKEYFTNKSFVTDGVWSQRNFNQSLPRQTGNQRTLNYYITIAKDKQNILKFWNSLGDLDKQLGALSNNKQSPISYKTHRLLDAFVDHNDSLKIYYYDSNLKTEIENIVKQWISNNGLKIGDRTHVHGVDIKGDNGGSFGQILANKVDETLINTINKYGDKYNSEQYFEWIKKYLPTIIKNVKVNN